MKRLGLYDVLLGGLVLTVISSGAVLMSIPVSADDVIDDFTININVSCTLFNNVGTPHTAEVPNGTYRADIGTTTIKAYCNDTNGFSIYAIGYTGEGYGVNTLVGTNVSTNTIATGTATSGQTSNWAMKLAAVSGTYTPTILNSYDSYHAVPTTFEKVATYTSATDVGTTMANASGSSLTTTYAAYVSYTQTADTYVGKVKYTLVHPNTEVPLQPQTTEAGKICYYPNGSNVEGTMGCQTIAASDTSATLLASNFSRAGYGFAGWSKTFDYSDDTGFLGPQEDITFTAGEYTGDNPGLSLYARWIESTGDLQGWTGCSSLQSGAVTALADQRDNETYAIAKLADGNCWMIENLRLEKTAAHNSDGSLAQGYGTSSGYGNFSGLADAESAGFSGTYTANSLYYSGTQEGTASINIGAGSYPAYRMPRYNNTNTSSRTTNNPAINNSAMYSYGNYYTWHAAIADTSYYSSGDHGTTSLCPAGWRLPIGNQSTANMSFGKLSASLGGPANGAAANTSSTPNAIEMSKIFRSYPNNFLFSGYYYTSSSYYKGSYGGYWSSTAVGNYGSYHLQMSTTFVNPGTTSSDRVYGDSVRCLLVSST